MSSDFPRTPREELEARLTALLLGELSADEAAAVRRALAQDAELTKLHNRLQATIGLVRETVATQAGPTAEQPPLRLSDERREKLLAHFKTAPLLPKLERAQQAKRSWLIPMSVAAALVVLAGIAVLSGLGGRNFGYLKSRTVSLSESPTLLTEGLSASSEPLDQVVTDSAIQGVSNVPPTRTVMRDGQPANLYSFNVVGYHKVTPPKTDGATTLSWSTGGKPVSPAPLAAAIAESEPHVTTPVPDAAARVAATTPADPASARRPSSSIVLPSLSQSTDGAKLAETKYAVGDQDWAVASERPALAHSEKNRFLGRYAYEAKPTSDAAVAAAKPESWYFEKDSASQHDFYSRLEGRSTTLWDDNSATRGFYSDTSAKDGFVIAQSADSPGQTEPWDHSHDFVDLWDHTFGVAGGRGQAAEIGRRGSSVAGETVTGLPAQTANGVTAAGIAPLDGFYGGYAVKPPPGSVELQGFAELGPERRTLLKADVDVNADKTLALGDTPELGQRFYRITGGVGDGGSGVQAQPVPPPASPALQADAGAVVSAATKSKGVELVPFQPQLPAPTLKGTPEDLPRDPNLEPLGAKPQGTVVLGQPEAAQATPAPEFQAAFRRRYGVASAGEPLAEGVAKRPAPAAKAPAVEGTTLNFGVATVKSPASVEAKEAPTAVGRGLTPLASARRGDEPTRNAGDLVLSRSTSESDRKQVAEVRERYLADGRELTEGERIAPAEKVQSMDVDALTVTTTTPKDVIGVAESGAATETAVKTKTLLFDPGAIRQGLESAGAVYAGSQEAGAPVVQSLWPRVGVAGGGRGGGDRPHTTLGTNHVDSLEGAIQGYFTALGADLDPKLGKSLSYDTRTGELTVRGTQEELDVIQSATEVLSKAVVSQGVATDPKPTNVGRPQSKEVRLSANVKQQEELGRTRRPASSIVLPSSETGKASPAATAESKVLQKELSSGYQRSVPNPYSRTNLARIGKGRQIITDKLTRIRLDDVQYSGLPLSEVLGQLRSESAKRDPDKKGVNFIFNPNTIPTSGNIDPTTGLPNNDFTNMVVTVSPSLSDVSLQDALDAITRASDPPLKYSIEEYAVVFSLDTSKPRKSRAATPDLIPQPEVQTSDNTFSTFSLNVSDVAFKLAAASLEKGQMPDAASVRAEEFINAFDYRDPEAPPGVPIAFAWERARYPFAHNRDLLRFSLKTAAAGRQAGRPLNLVLLLDNSGSMERADRVQIIREALRVLAGQLQPQDKLSVITFARTPRLWMDGVAGDKSGEVLDQVSGLTPQGGTNLEEAMNLAYATALRHYLAGGINRVVLLTDGAANLGNVESESLKQKVEVHRKQGIALDCFGIGWEGFNDDLLEVLSRNGDGRYGFINSPEEAATEFAGQLAGALKVAASDVKVQVEFNPKRVTAYRQIGYAKHQLTKEQFRDNTVDAAEIAAQEAGNALYTVEVNPAGEGPLCTVRCRFKIPGTTDYREHEWVVAYTGNAVSLEQASPAMRLAASASAFAEWLVVSPFAAEVTPDALLGYLGGVPEVYGADARPKKLEWMIRQAKSIGGK